MGESEKYIGEGRLCDKEEVERIANAEKIAALRKRCEEFMREVYAYVLSVQQKIDIFEKNLKK